MSIVETIKTRIKIAMVEGNIPERDILKVALGEIQTEQMRKPSNKNQYKKDLFDPFVLHIIPEDMPDEEAIKIIRKIIENIDYTKEIYMRSPAVSDQHWTEKKEKLDKEKEILSTLLPKETTKKDIENFIDICDPEVLKNILLAKSDGQAIGSLMKALKEAKINANGKMVGEIVKKMREAAK